MLFSFLVLSKLPYWFYLFVFVYTQKRFSNKTFFILIYNFVLFCFLFALLFCLFFCFLFNIGAVYAGVFIMFNEFSFVMTEHFGHSTFEVTLLFGFVIIGLLIGSILSAIITCFKPKYLIGYSIFQIFGCGVVLILPFILYSSTAPVYVGLNEYWTLAPLCLYVGSDGLMMAPLMSTAVEPFRAQAGTANALSLFWRFFCGAVLALIISISSDAHLYVLHFGISGMAVLSTLIFLVMLYPATFPNVTPKGAQPAPASSSTTAGKEGKEATETTPLTTGEIADFSNTQLNVNTDGTLFIPIKDGEE